MSVFYNVTIFQNDIVNSEMIVSQWETVISYFTPLWMNWLLKLDTFCSGPSAAFRLHGVSQGPPH